jgi:hypothetical protein
MKNLFEKDNTNTVIALSLLGSIAAAAAVYLYLTKSGAAVRGNAKKKVKAKIKDKASGLVSRKTGISKKAVKTVADAVVR